MKPLDVIISVAHINQIVTTYINQIVTITIFLW